MKILAFSFNHGVDRKSVVKSKFKELKDDGYSLKDYLILFPGNEADSRRDSDVEWAGGLAKLYKTNILAERGKVYSTGKRGKNNDNGGMKKFFVLFEPNKEQKTKLPQWATSSESPKANYIKLAEALNEGKRDVCYKNKAITTLICGENNILANEQNKRNLTDWRYKKKEAELDKRDIFIIFNPLHLEMGNGEKIEARFKWLTDENRRTKHAIILSNRGGISHYPSGGLGYFEKGERDKETPQLLCNCADCFVYELDLK